MSPAFYPLPCVKYFPLLFNLSGKYIITSLPQSAEGAAKTRNQRRRCRDKTGRCFHQRRMKAPARFAFPWLDDARAFCDLHKHRRGNTGDFKEGGSPFDSGRTASFLAQSLGRGFFSRPVSPSRALPARLRASPLCRAGASGSSSEAAPQRPP